MKNSFSLFEVVITIFISSFVIINSMYFTKELFVTQKNLLTIEINKIDLLSTKAFLEVHKKELKNKLIVENEILYFNSKVLLTNISDFNMSINSNIIEINISINKEIQQIWKFSL